MPDLRVSDADVMTVPACPGPGDEQPGRAASVALAVVGPLAPGDDARAVPADAMPPVCGPLAPGATEGDEPTTETRAHPAFGPGDVDVPRAAMRVTRK